LYEWQKDGPSIVIAEMQAVA